MNELRNLLTQLSTRQRVLIVAAVCIVAASLYFIQRWNKERDLRPLFANLAAEDAGAVMDKLRTANVEYTVADNGTILVPSARVAELRLDMAAAGLPKTGRIGFEIFDKQNFGASEFDEQVQYRRAIEGELERSVMTLSGVEGSRVHVTFSKDSVFSELREPAKASLLIKLRPGATLSAQNISALQHLAASAVEGLKPEAVSVVDMNGNLLGRPRAALDSDSGMSPAGLEYRQSLERDLVVKIRSTLDPLLGAEKYRAGVTIDCDFTSGDESEETFDPDRSVMASSQRSEDATGSNSTGGVPGTASNLPRPVPPSTSGRGAVSRKTENVIYQTSRVVKHIKLPQGAIRRVSAAVILDQALHWEGTGASATRVLEPPSPEKLKIVRDVVAGAVGFQQERGDQILIDTLPFDATLSIPAPEPPRQRTPAVSHGTPGAAPDPLQRLRAIPPVWLGAGTALAIVFVVFMVVMSSRALRRKARGKSGQVQVQPQLDAAAGVPQLAAASDFGTKAMAQLAEARQAQEQAENDALQVLKTVPSTRKSDIYKKFVIEESKKDPARIAQLVRTWLKGEGA
jgi:flagellar M-ring protein FliF